MNVRNYKVFIDLSSTKTRLYMLNVAILDNIEGYSFIHQGDLPRGAERLVNQNTHLPMVRDAHNRLLFI